MRLRPDDPDAHLHLANAYQAARDWENSLSEYRVALEMRPNSPELHYNYAMALRRRACRPTPCSWSRRPTCAAVGHLLQLSEYISLAIPRGGEGLIRRVSEEAKMPVIKHYAGNCHVYLDRSADADMAENVVINAKCQRMGVCNAAESLLVHADAAAALSPRLGRALLRRGVEIRGDDRTRCLLPEAKPATEDDYRAEYLGPVISCKVVDSLDEAIRHINEYGSQHTDAIVTRDLEAAPVRRPRGLLRGDDQREHAVQRRGRVRPGGGDRHQHRQVPRPRTLRHRGIDQLQVRGVWNGAGERITTAKKLSWGTLIRVNRR